ncbi:class I SAM-dependent methyltransferase [Enterococcus viikkiensis]|uniref:Class I SAM-dependent methyltransferase n=1 Tax=Enterococcus viikkiensis TaxID=930854 RepID=A0ABU3FQI8_9ENTE|nr:class I SAM-dependent methyltransferase [Enterococcus viikkiensis]
MPIDTIVSNMVFHHLTDSGKEQAIKQYNRRENYLRRHAVFI